MQDWQSLKILVVDDSILYRRIICEVLAEIPGVEVVGTAHNGRLAFNKILHSEPDLLILDIEMPEMNGLEVLLAIKERALQVGVIMLSSLTRQGSEITVRALQLGAFDFITKPDHGSMAENLQYLKHHLTPIIKAWGRRLEIKRIFQSRAVMPEVSREGGETAQPLEALQGSTGRGYRKGKSRIVGIGISTGGPQALAQMLPQFPADLGAPVLVVQHMPPFFTNALAVSLNAKCPLEVKEASDGVPILPNRVFIAPGGKQMKIAEDPAGSGKIIRITDDPPENSCKPSVDYLFRSLAHHFGASATAVIMTGMGSDGTKALHLLKRQGATVIAQDEATCVVYGMSRGPIEAGIVDVIAPLNEIAAEIRRSVRP